MVQLMREVPPCCAPAPSHRLLAVPRRASLFNSLNDSIDLINLRPQSVRAANPGNYKYRKYNSSKFSIYKYDIIIEARFFFSYSIPRKF